MKVFLQQKKSHRFILKAFSFTLFIFVPLLGFVLGRITTQVQKNIPISITPSPVSRIGPSVTGLLFTSGLNADEKKRLNLRYSSFQLIQKSGTAFFLEYRNDDALQNLVGSCIRIDGTTSPNQLFSPQDGYARRVYIPSRITRLSPTDCQMNDAPTSSSLSDIKTIRLEGTVIRITRPAPDISYDYGIMLSIPYTDTENASGRTQQITTVTAVPQTDSIRRLLNSKVGMKITAAGSMEWGYAESRHFVVRDIAN